MSEEPLTLFELKREVLENYKSLYCEDCNERETCDLFDLNVIERCKLAWDVVELRRELVEKLFSDIDIAIDDTLEVGEMEDTRLKCPRCDGDLKTKHVREDKYADGSLKYTILFECANRFNGCDVEFALSLEPKEFFEAIDAGLRKRDTSNDKENLRL